MQEFEPVPREAFDRDELVGIVERLIDRCRDGEQIYADSADHIHDRGLQERFREYGRERAQYASDLEAALERIGRWQTTRQGSVKGMLERTMYDVKRLAGGGDHAIRQALESYEDHARDAYEEALKHRMPEDLMGLLRTQAQAVYAAHHQMKALRDRKAA